MAAELIYTSIGLRNTWSYEAVVEGVRLVGATPGLLLVDVRLARPGVSPEIASLAVGTGSHVDELQFGTDYQPLPAPLPGNRPDHTSMTLVVTAIEPGDYSYQAVAVDYRVGQLSFTVTEHQALAVCLGPLPIGAVCSIDSEDD